MGTWLVAIRAELNDAMVAARLVQADLARVQAAGIGAEPSAAIWTANSGALAKPERRFEEQLADAFDRRSNDRG